MDLMEKLEVLTDAAKYDVACTSSGTSRASQPGMLGSAVSGGICHSFAADGRCISLLKILQTNICIYDCQYCVNRRSNDVRRTMFTPDEVADLTINFYRRNYIEGLFLSSAVVKDPNYTMEMLYQTLSLVRNKYRFNGYIHVKAIPGADADLIRQTGFLADRMSVNIELPSEESLKRLAPEKTKESILNPMKMLRENITQSKQELTVYRHAPQFVPSGQATQLIIGATPDSDLQIVSLAEGLYKNYRLRRVFYSAYNPTLNAKEFLPTASPPLLREHRLYQADFLIRFYGFQAREIFDNGDDRLHLNLDPKCHWALNHLSMFPVEINTANESMLLRVPGIGPGSVSKILTARKVGNLDFGNLKKMGIVLKRAKYFITCNGKMMEKVMMKPDVLEMRLTENKIGEGWQQLGFEEVMGHGLLETEAKTAAIEEKKESSLPLA